MNERFGTVTRNRRLREHYREAVLIMTRRMYEA
jgi:hypothetical protein